VSFPFAGVAVAGTGLIGCSIALRARQAGSDVSGWDPAPQSLDLALRGGALDRTCASFEELAAQDGVLILAAPLEATLDLLAHLRARPSGAALILDVASLKLPVVERAAGLPRFVATHPMAGSESSGPGSAGAGLFEGAAWCYVPSGDAALDARACAFIEALGAAPLAASAAAHDAAVAFTSQLPQLVAVALAASLGERLGDEALARLCGPGLASMTRLGRSPWAMWRSLLLSPASRAAQEVRTFSEVLAGVALELEAGSTGALQQRFTSARAALDRLETMRANANDRGAAPVTIPPMNEAR
jgi:prephenate dehydrogenase